MTEKKVLSYKNYEGTAECSVEDECLFGKILHINATIIYSGNNFPEIKQAFQEAVDEYLQMCKELKIEPEKPYKGSLNIRINPDTHKQLARIAVRTDVSLNSLIDEVLTEHVNFSCNKLNNKSEEYLLIENITFNKEKIKAIKTNLENSHSEYFFNTDDIKILYSKSENNIVFQ